MNSSNIIRTSTSFSRALLRLHTDGAFASDGGGSNIYVSKCSQLSRMGERTRTDFFGTGTNSRNIPERPLLFHERSLACIRTGHSQVVGTVEYLSCEVFAIQALFMGSAHHEPISLTR